MASHWKILHPHHLYMLSAPSHAAGHLHWQRAYTIFLLIKKNWLDNSLCHLGEPFFGHKVSRAQDDLKLLTLPQLVLRSQVCAATPSA